MQERSTGERHTGKNDERGVAPAPVPADVGIVAAMPIEVGDLIERPEEGPEIPVGRGSGDRG